VIAEARNHLGLGAEDFDIETIEQIADYLDAESDKLMPPVDIASAFKRLAGRGELPSDLYTVNVVQNLSDQIGKRARRVYIPAVWYGPFQRPLPAHRGVNVRPFGPALIYRAGAYGS
jgi:hypothetical protein